MGLPVESSAARTVAASATVSTATVARIATVLRDSFFSIVPWLLLDRKNPKRAAGRDFGQPFVAGKQRVDAAIAARHGDILHAVLLPGHRLSLDARAGLELPELLAGVGIEGLELAGQGAREYDAARGRQHAGEARDVAWCFPLRLAGHGIDRLQMTARAVTPFPEIGEVHAEIPFTLLEGGGFGFVPAAEGERVGVSEAGLRIERHRLPVLAAKDRRIHCHLLALTRLLRDVGLDGTSGLHVDSRHPVDLHVRIGREQLSVGAVEHVEEA